MILFRLWTVPGSVQTSESIQRRRPGAAAEESCPAAGAVRGGNGGGGGDGRLPSCTLRLIDDLLILTPSRAAAEALIFRLLNGGFLA